MAGRPVDTRRRAALLDAAVDQAAQNGFADLSWRTMAAALGTSPTTLVHHFGTKEELLDAILTRLRERVAAGTAAPDEAPVSLAAHARSAWAWSSAPEQAPTFRLFFAVYGQALQSPERFGSFLAHVGHDLLTSLRAAQGPDVDARVATRRATLAIATLRGLLLDLLAGRDPARVHDAAEAYLASIDDGRRERQDLS